MSESKANPRDNILDAAQRVAGKEGADNLTLDKVACECGMSKGGLLYNFPNKDALLAGMLDRLLEQHKSMMDSEEKSLAGEPNACLKAMLGANACHEVADPGVYLSLLAASAHKPELMAPVKETLAEYYQRLQNESSDPDMATILWLAAEGLIFHAILGLAPYSQSEKNRLFQKLMQISEEAL